MKKSRLSDSQIMGILQQAEPCTPEPEPCRTHGMSTATFYKWRAKFGLRRLRDRCRRSCTRCVR